MAYYGFKKYTYQRTRTLVPGDEFGGVALSYNSASTPAQNISAAMPSASALAGTLMYNNSGQLTALSDIASAVAALSTPDIAGQVGVLAEDIPAYPAKVVLFELTTRDIDNLEVRTTPKLPKDFDGNNLYI